MDWKKLENRWNSTRPRLEFRNPSLLGFQNFQGRLFPASLSARRYGCEDGPVTYVPLLDRKLFLHSAISD